LVRWPRQYSAGAAFFAVVTKSNIAAGLRKNRDSGKYPDAHSGGTEPYARTRNDWAGGSGDDLAGYDNRVSRFPDGGLCRDAIHSRSPDWVYDGGRADLKSRSGEGSPGRRGASKIPQIEVSHQHGHGCERQHQVAFPFCLFADLLPEIGDVCLESVDLSVQSGDFQIRRSLSIRSKRFISESAPLRVTPSACALIPAASSAKTTDPATPNSTVFIESDSGSNLPVEQGFSYQVLSIFVQVNVNVADR
jgi:hypothetical protein